MSSLQQELINLKPQKEFFVGIDSDGCAFDTMELKHKECFCPNTIKYWNLQKVSKYARETWEFINLYSKFRGINRFLALVQLMELLKDREKVKVRNVKIPDLQELKKWVEKESKLSNLSLEKYIEKVNDPILHKALEWSSNINKDVAEMAIGLPPFPYLKESLMKLSEKADIIVVSQTPVETLRREWDENNISKFVKLIAGQEYGTKKEHIELAAVGKYPAENILMIGDAPGDLKAAKDNGVLFYPINPGYEEQSWANFYSEAIDKFFNKEFAGKYESKLIDYFNSLLPDEPKWEK